MQALALPDLREMSAEEAISYDREGTLEYLRETDYGKRFRRRLSCLVRNSEELFDNVMLALALDVTLRNNRLDEITADLDAGAGAGLLRIYDGTRPASGGAATTLLAELTFSDPSFPAASSGSMTANSITQDSSANATATATWFRCVDSNSNWVIDGDVGTSGSDLNLNTTAITTGAAVSVSSFVLNEGNA